MTETVEVAPQSCVDALDTAEMTFGIASEGLGVASDIIIAASTSDINGIVSGTDEITAQTDELGTLMVDYETSALLCRSAVQ